MKIFNNKRVIAYIDGFNLYFGLHDKRWKNLYWLNVQKFALNLIRGYQTLVCVKYFTAKIGKPPDKERRQRAYLEALETLQDVKIYYGRYQFEPKQCAQCKTVADLPQEKKTDVNIATELLLDAFFDRFDTALLVSADADLTAAIHAIKDNFKNKSVVVAFPPERSSTELQTTAHTCFHIGKKKFELSQFPDSVTKADGYIINRPPTWK